MTILYRVDVDVDVLTMFFKIFFVKILLQMVLIVQLFFKIEKTISQKPHRKPLFYSPCFCHHQDGKDIGTLASFLKKYLAF